MPRDKVKPVKVRRDEADEVYIATATEPLRRGKAKNPVQLTQAERDRNNTKAEEIVLKAQSDKKRGKK